MFTSLPVTTVTPRVLAEVSYFGAERPGGEPMPYSRLVVVDPSEAPAAIVQGRLRDALTKATSFLEAQGGSPVPSYAVEQVQEGVYELRSFDLPLRDTGLVGADYRQVSDATRVAETAVALIGKGEDGYNWVDLRGGGGKVRSVPFVPGSGVVVRD